MTDAPKVKKDLSPQMVTLVRGKGLAGISRANILSEAGPALNGRTLDKLRAALGFGKISPDVRKADAAICKAMLVRGGSTEAEADKILKPITAAQKAKLDAPKIVVPEATSKKSSAKKTAKSSRKSATKKEAAAATA